MRIKFLSSLLLAGAVAASAQGFKDGIQYYNADNLEEASIILNRTIGDAATDKAQANYYLGAIALKNGDKAAAQKYFNEGIAVNPDFAYNYVGLGAVDLVNGDKNAAEAEFKKAQSLAKKDAVIYVDMARAYHFANPTAYAKEIDKMLEKAIKINKKHPAIYILQADMIAPTNVGEAAGLYDMAMAFDIEDNNEIDHPESYVKYARTYFTVNPTYSIDRLKALLEKQPNSALAQRELAEKYYDNNQFTMAAEQYGKYIQNPNHFKKDEIRYVALLNFGKKYQESFDLATKILSEDPGNMYMQRLQFLDQAAMKNYQEAEKYAKIFFANPAAKGKYVPNDFTTYGTVLQELGQDTVAVAQFEEAVKTFPDKKDLLLDLSAAYTKAKMYPQAAEAQQKYIDLGDYSTNDLFVLARRYQNVAATSETGTPEREAAVNNAIKYVDEVIAKVPDNYNLPFTKARILLIKNDNKADEETINAFKQTVDLLDKNPDNKTARKDTYVTCYNQIGNYYLGQGDMENAKVYFTKFLEIDPENQPLREFIETKLK